MNYKHFLIPVLALMGCGALHAQSADSAPSPSPDSGHHQHWRHHHARIWKKLNLTDAQKAQIKSIKQAMKDQTRPALAAVLKAKLQLHQDINQDSGPATQTKIASDASALATAEAQFATVRATEVSQIKRVLTQDQQTILADLQQKRQTRMQNWIDKLSQPST
jgi:protein CpxP